MHSLPLAPDATPEAREMDRLRGQLDHERRRRVAAEGLSSRTTANLQVSLQQLRKAQSQMEASAERDQVVHDVARELRQELDLHRLLARAVSTVGPATGVDRCQVHVVHPAAELSDWVSPLAQLPEPVPLSLLPPGVARAVAAGVRDHAPVVFRDLLDDDQLGRHDGRRAAQTLGCRALLMTPMWSRDVLIGWLSLQSVGPRPWRQRDTGISAGVAADLGLNILQVHAYHQQRESMARLEALDHAKDAFISNVSHELRTPLTSIAGYIEMIEEGVLGELSDDALRAVGVINRNAERLRSLVEHLLTLSAHDSQAVRLELSQVDMGVVLTECHDELLPAVARQGLDLEVVSHGLTRPIEADREQVTRVVVNLLSNAVKFTPAGGRVRVTAESCSSGVRLVVSDTGMGIPAAEQDRLFSRFFRSSLTTAAEIQGTGLGLSLVKSIVDGHGGTVSLESTEGVGTTVTVDLPAGPPRHGSGVRR